MPIMNLPTTLWNKLKAWLISPSMITHPFEAAVSSVELGFASTRIARLWGLFALLVWGVIALLVPPVEVGAPLGVTVGILLVVGRRYVISHGERSGPKSIATCQQYFRDNALYYSPEMLKSIQNRVTVRLAALQVGIGLPLLTIGALYTIYSVTLKGLTLPILSWAELAILFLLFVDSYVDRIQRSATYTVLYEAAEEQLQAGPLALDPQMLAFLTVQIVQAEKIGRLEAQVALLQAPVVPSSVASTPRPLLTTPTTRRSLLRWPW